MSAGLVARSRMHAARRAGSRGYNMIEVMMALAILAVGASGVIALQKVTILGVTSGRNLTAASTIAAAHIESLRTDAVRWTNSGNLTSAPLLSALAAAPDVWTAPSTTTGLGGLGLTDVTGVTDSAVTAPVEVAYCTQVRATPIAFSTDALPAPILFRIEARTFWAKSGRPVTTECAAAPGAMDNILNGTLQAFNGVNYAADDYGFVFLATSVRRNDALGS